MEPGLNDILRAKGIKIVAVAGFTSDVCVHATVLSAYDLGYHVYALRRARSDLSIRCQIKCSTASIRCGRRSSATTNSTA